jgi:hypothetical protein
MTTVATLAQTIKTKLDGSSRAARDQLASTMTTAATVLTLKHDQGYVSDGDYAAVGDEVVYVWSAKEAPQLTVARAALGTTAAQYANDTEIEFKPTHPLGHVIASMKEEVLGLPRDLFKVKTQTIAVTSSDTEVTLTPDVRIDQILGADTVALTNYPSRPVSVRRGLGNTVLYTGPPVPYACDLTVTWTEPFDVSAFASSTDLQSNVGLETEWLDIVQYGTIARRVFEMEALRADIDVLTVSRNDDDFPPTYGTQVGQMYIALRDKRIAEESLKLKARYPTRHMG